LISLVHYIGSSVQVEDLDERPSTTKLKIGGMQHYFIGDVMESRKLLMLVGILSVAALAVWLLSRMLESPAGGGLCDIPRSYDVIFGDIIYIDISKESMEFVINHTVGRVCRVMENC